MTNELSITYKLYALDVNKEGLEEAAKSRFCRITPFYILIYTQPENEPHYAIEITQTETHRLSAEDERWLADCNIVILAEEAKKHESEIAQSMADRLKKLEEILALNTAQENGKSED